MTAICVGLQCTIKMRKSYRLLASGFLNFLELSLQVIVRDRIRDDGASGTEV